MTSTSPGLIAAIVVLALGAIGALIYLVLNYKKFHGYGEIAGDAKALARELSGEVFRDGHDLVIAGEYHDLPVLLRFSNDDNTPAMNLEVRIPSSLHLCVSPKQVLDNKLGSKVKLNDWLEQRFVGRSKTALDTEMLLDQRSTMNLLVRLCCSQKTMLEINPGKLHLLEMVVPVSLGRHVLEHLADIRDLARVIESLPGSDAVKIKPIPRERSSWTFRAAVAAGVVVAAVSVLAATRDRSKPAVASVADSPTINGILKVDAASIAFVEKWRVATPDDLDASFATWLSGFGLQPSSRVEFQPDDAGRAKGVAYLLVNQEGAKRLVLLVDHHVTFDSSFSALAGLARVPATAFNKIQWGSTSSTREQSAGDGILFVCKGDDPRTAVILYWQNGKLQSGAPSDYRRISFE